MSIIGKMKSDLIGRQETEHDECALPLVRRVLITFDRQPTELKHGDPLPKGWQFIMFTYNALQKNLGADGTASDNSFVPTAPGFPRRMMGGRRSRYISPIAIGSAVKRVNEIVAIEQKSGRSGDFIIATTRQSWFVDGASEPSLEEEYDAILRQPADGKDEARQQPLAQAQIVRDGVELTTIDEKLLFRYSALTFNAHRIHYDYPYALEAEGYPALVVNGGLTTFLLVEQARKLLGEAAIARTAVTLLSAVYVNQPVRLCWTREPDGLTLWAENAQEKACVRMKVFSKS
jgi:3-methylfumaryl-CoA hydratase